MPMCMKTFCGHGHLSLTHLLLNTESQVLYILLADSGQIHSCVRQVTAFLWAQHASILYHTPQSGLTCNIRQMIFLNLYTRVCVRPDLLNLEACEEQWVLSMSRTWTRSLNFQPSALAVSYPTIPIPQLWLVPQRREWWLWQARLPWA